MQTEDYEYLYALEEDFWWFAGMRDITAALLAPYCGDGGSRMILDAGCGTGGMLGWLSRYCANGKVVGIDLNSDALRFCSERGHEPLARASAIHLPFADSVFDLVTSFDVLSHIQGDGADDRAIKEMFRVLTPRGIVFVRGAAFEWMRSGHDRALGTERRYSLAELAGKLTNAGFHILRSTYANSLLLPAVALRRLVLKRVGLADKGSDVKPLPPSLGWLNGALTRALWSEALMLKHLGLRLPAGVSAICIAEKPHD